MENPRPSSSSEYISQKFIGTDKISEILNASDSDDGSFSELSDSDTCKVNSPFSSRSKEDEFSSQYLTEAGRELTGPFLNMPIQILSEDGQNKLKQFRNLPS
jgi:hypothetical protein